MWSFALCYLVVATINMGSRVRQIMAVSKAVAQCLPFSCRFIQLGRALGGAEMGLVYCAEPCCQSVCVPGTPTGGTATAGARMTCIYVCITHL